MPQNRCVRIVSVSVFITAVLFVLYFVFALYVLPIIIKSYLERKAGEFVGGEAHVGVVETQPFALALIVRDFSVANKTFKLTWDSLYINAQLSSIPARSIRLDELRIHDLNIMLELDEKSSVSQFEFATQAFLARANEPLYIERFVIQNGALEILDKRAENENRFVIKPVSFSLEKFSTQYSAEQGNNYNLQFTGLNGGFFRWNGNLQWMPFLSEGEMEIRGLDMLQFRDFYQKHLPFVLQNGTVDLRTGYRLAEEPELNIELKNAKLALNKPSLIADSSKLAMRASSIQLETLQFSTLNRTFFTDNIILDSVNVNYHLLEVPKQPDPNLFEFIRYNANVPDSASANAFSAFLRKATNLPHWQIQIDSIKTEQARIELTDSIIAPAVVYNLNVEQLLLTDVSNHADKSVNVHFLSSLNDFAKLNLQGTVHLFPIYVNGILNIKDFPLADLQSYLTQASWLTLRQGIIANSTLDMRWNPATDTLLFSGNMEIGNLRLFGIDNSPLIGMRQIDVKDLALIFAPDPRLQIARADVQAPVVYLTRLANLARPANSANFSQIMKPKAKGSGTGMPWDINQINFSRGTIYIADKSPATPFSHYVTSVQGNIRNSNLSAQGKIGGYAPFSAKGVINLKGKNPNINFTAEFANQDLIAFSPYSGWHAGYRISKGQAALQVDYKIQNNKVQGKNHIVIQHLTFGEKVESPEATNIPVRLGVALLSDKDGIIDLDVAIEGDLDDPEFSVGSLIWKIIKNLLGKAISAPFKSLMSLVGSNSDPENIAFAPGSENLAQEQIDALKNLSQALIQRPQLQVDVRGNADSIADGNVLKESQLLRMLTHNMPDASAKWTAASVKKPPLRDTLFAYYRRTEKKDWHFGENEQEESLAQASEQIWKELLAKQKLPDNALSNLARARAQNIKRELINVNAALGERIFVVDDNHLSQSAANLRIREY
jgi:outer membrane protein OmpA-like peptidoglycan-associated protein